ncbi:MAG: hypothetical protein ACTHKH_10155 [Trinickia sp.]
MRIVLAAAIECLREIFDRIRFTTPARVSIIVFTLSVAACTSPIIVSVPGELRGEPARGSVKPLAEYLRTTDGHAARLKLVFIHGIGDMCPGYALGANSWLSGPNLAAVGFAPLGNATPPERIYSNEFLGGKRIDDSFVALSKRAFLFAPRSEAPAKAVHIEAIEITYSPLTQWLKSQQLGYDLTGPFRSPDDPAFACVANVPPYYAAPPARERFNRVMKEALIDRGLADAVLYMGPYGQAMRSGVAEALCRALSDQMSAGRCVWPAPEPDTHYIFVTHSLGSRVIYDTLLALLDPTSCSGGVSVAAGQQEAASRFAASVIANSPVVYMMANQLPLIGLARMPPRVQPQPAGEGQPSAGTSGVVGTPPGECGGLRQFARARQTQQARQLPTGASSTLDIVAFNDTDDVLSWGLPKWYVRKLPAVGEQRLNIQAVNVYVQNATRWFGAYEDTGKAHIGYFTNPQVWQIIKCGARHGKPLSC